MPEIFNATDKSVLAGVLLVNADTIVTDAAALNADKSQVQFQQVTGKLFSELFFLTDGSPAQTFLEELKNNKQFSAYLLLKTTILQQPVYLEGLYFTGSGLFQLSVYIPVDTAAAQNLKYAYKTENYRPLEPVTDLRSIIKLQKAAIEATNDIIFVKDITGKYLLVNSAFIRFTELEETQIYGKTDFELFSEINAKKVTENDRQVLQNSQELFFEETYTIRGNTYTFLTSKAPVISDLGEVIGLSGIIRDITALKKAEASLVESRKEHELLHMNIHTQEEERCRIAEVLHNTIGQIFYALKYNLQNLKTINSENQDVHDTLYALVKEGISETKNISFQMRPTLLEDFGMCKCIQKLTEKLSNPELPIHFSSSGQIIRLPLNTEMAIYRVVQELLNNVVRHSKATTASVSVSFQENQVCIFIDDNGEGFLVQNAIDAENCSGLKTIRRRLQYLDARFEIKSSPKKGTNISICLDI